MTRLRNVQAFVKKNKLDHLLIESPLDLYYLTGLDLSLGSLFVQAEESTLFVDGRYIDFARANAPCKVLPLEDLKGVSPKTITFDSAFISYDRYLTLQKMFPDAEFAPLQNPVKVFRGTKDASEVEKVKKAAALTKEGFEHIRALLKEGVLEEELALEFEIFCRKKGASKLSFSPIVAFGKNSAYPHYHSGKVPLEKDQIVLFDLGCVVDGYAGDMTRVVFFGKADERLEEDYKIVKRAQEKAIEAAKPGVRFGVLYEIVQKELEDAGVYSLFTHGLSHGIGLDVHEYPYLKLDGKGDVDLILEPGMTFTVEPGVYRDGLGGVRYEDVVIVTQDGNETV